MPLVNGSLTARVWRVADPLARNFKETFERNLPRHAFTPPDPERGQIESIGWVNIRQILDSRLTLDKVMVRNHIVLALRADRLAINQRVFRATLAQEIGRKLREVKRERLSREERAVIEDKVKLEMLKRTQPSTAIHEMAWHLESGLVWFGSNSQRMTMVFSDLFTETFQVALEAQFPFMRAQRWAERQGLATELMELLPAPLSPEAPLEVVQIDPETDEHSGASN
jgi:hypothetical protein